MKKLIAVLMGLCMACNKAPAIAQSPRPAVHLHSRAKILTALSLPVHHCGVTALEQLYYKGDEVSYKYTGRKSGTITYRQVAKNEIELKLVNETATTLRLNRKTALFVQRGVDLFKAPILDLAEQTNIALALHLYNELASDVIPRSKGAAGRPLNPHCEEFTAMYFQYTRSAAEYELNAYVDVFLGNNTNCSRKYGVDAGCLWEDYACVATQAIECCDAPL